MVTFMPTPIGNLSDISLRALSTLNNCEVIICEDTRVTKKLLTLLLKNPLVLEYFPNIDSKNKRFLSFHSHNQNEFLQKLDSKHFGYDFFDLNIVFCTDAGMPNISDPGAIFLQYVRKNNIKYEILLGGSAFSHAFVCSGLEGNFCFLGFLPHKKEERLQSLKYDLKFINDLHLIYYESPKRLKDSLQDISQIIPNARIFVYKELTKLYESEYIGTPKEILDCLPQEILGEYCIIIEKNKENYNKEILQLSKDDILQLDINPKQKAKLLAKITNKDTKEWYNILVKESEK